MPQFDTFSFLSQIFWVFFCFFLLYISLVYYLLPAIAVTLKIRQRKLSNSSLSTSSSDSLVSNSVLSLTRETFLRISMSRSNVFTNQLALLSPNNVMGRSNFLLKIRALHFWSSIFQSLESQSCVLALLRKA